MGTHALGNQVVWFDVPCRDLDRAIAFYSAVLGCTVEKQGVAEHTLGVLPHEGDSVGGCLVTGESHTPSDHGILVYLNCQGRLDDAIAEVVPNGGKVVQAKHSIEPYGERALIIDSEGNHVALHSMST